MINQFICAKCGMNSSKAGEVTSIGSGNRFLCGVCGADLNVQPLSAKELAESRLAYRRSNARYAYAELAVYAIVAVIALLLVAVDKWVK